MADRSRPRRSLPWTEAAAQLRSLTRTGGAAVASLEGPDSPSAAASAQRRELVAWVVQDLSTRLAVIGATFDALEASSMAGMAAFGQWEILHTWLGELAVLVKDLAALVAAPEAATSAAEGGEDFTLAYEGGPPREAEPSFRAAVAVRRVTMDAPLAASGEVSA